MKVLIFGTGEVAGRIFEVVQKEFEIVGFLDNSTVKQGTYYDNTDIMIYAPSDIHKLQFDKVVIASEIYASEIFTQLLGLGVREHDIIIDYICRNQRVYLYDFLKMQTDTLDKWNRIDIIVKYMAVDSYMKHETYGIQLYLKMQERRLRIDRQEAMKQWERYRALIESFQTEGYIAESAIVCDEKMRIMDGAHRVALSLYYGIDMIPVKITLREFHCHYEIDWFRKNDFSEEETDKILQTAVEISSSFPEEFIACVWPPAMEYADNLANDLSEYVDVKRRERKHFDTWDDVEHCVRGIYSVDNIEPWKLEQKIKHMFGGGGQEIEIITLQIKNPIYRLKASTSLPLSTKAELIKRELRSKYKDKIVDYYYDNILHIADNYYQSKLIGKILSMDYDISVCFDRLFDEKYVLAKLDVPYMPKDFPRKYPIHKDADILCLKSGLNCVTKIIRDFADEYAMRYGLQNREIIQRDRVKIRMEYLEFLIYQFDISCLIERAKVDFIERAVQKRQPRRNFYILSEEDEIVIRMNEVNCYPNKKHHMKWLQDKGIDIAEGKILSGLVDVNSGNCKYK